MKIKTLLEARRNPTHSAQKKLVGMEPFDKYKDLNDVEKYFVSYTDIKKVGVNPMSAYGTPIGVYTYPMSYLLLSERMDEVPFAGDREYVHIIKAVDPILILNNYDNLHSDMEKIGNYLKKEYPEHKSVQLINDAISSAKYNKNMNASRMWNIARLAGEFVSKKAKKRNSGQSDDTLSSDTIYFNSILRKVLGYTIIQDNGLGIIHPNESTQCVFLTSNSYQLVETIKNTKNNLDENMPISRAYNKLDWLRTYKLQNLPIERFRKLDIVKRLESIISKSAHYSQQYAMYVLHNRFVEAEDVIAKDARSSLSYAFYVLKNRFEKGELAMAEIDDVYYSYIKKFPAAKKVMDEYKGE